MMCVANLDKNIDLICVTNKNRGFYLTEGVLLVIFLGLIKIKQPFQIFAISPHILYICRYTSFDGCTMK